MMQFDLDLELVYKTIKERNCKTAGLQFPEGLKRQAMNIARGIEEKTDAKVIISGNPCFGSCDVDTVLAKNVDVLFHFGHTEMDKHDNVVFIEGRSNIDIIPALRKALPLFRTDRIGLITTVQHVHKLDEACRFMEENGKKCTVGKGDKRTIYPGQVLGCNFTAARVDSEEILYIGSGVFHPLGAAIASGKKVVAADPYLKEAAIIDPEKFLRKRGGYIARSMDAQVFGMIVSTKSGQNRIELANRLKELAKKHGKHAFIIQIDFIDPDRLLALKADAYVNTACPRITIDDAERYPAPLITPQEFEIVIGVRKWNKLEMDEIIE